MTITSYEMLEANTAAELAALVAAAIADDKQPFGQPSVAARFDGTVVVGQKFYQAVVEGSAVGTFEDLEARVAAAEAAITAAEGDIGDLETWTGTIATKLNADATENNALSDFPLTFDTDYAGV